MLPTLSLEFYQKWEKKTPMKGLVGATHPIARVYALSHLLMCAMYSTVIIVPFYRQQVRQKNLKNTILLLEQIPEIRQIRMKLTKTGPKVYF